MRFDFFRLQAFLLCVSVVAVVLGNSNSGLHAWVAYLIALGCGFQLILNLIGAFPEDSHFTEQVHTRWWYEFRFVQFLRSSFFAGACLCGSVLHWRSGEVFYAAFFVVAAAGCFLPFFIKRILSHKKFRERSHRSFAEAIEKAKIDPEFQAGDPSKNVRVQKKSKAD